MDRPVEKLGSRQLGLIQRTARLVGADSVLADIAERKRVERAAQLLISIVQSSDDAIISKDLNGAILSWNNGAEQLFGYFAEEAIGKPISMLIPLDRQDEEARILGCLGRGEHVDHYETVRQRKDGRLVEISLTVSPIKDAEGRVIGASTIAKDITKRKRAEETQALLLDEIKHRVKNTLGTIQAIATQTFRNASREERDSFSARLRALANAHDLLTNQNGDRAALSDMVRSALAPFRENSRERIQAAGPEAWLGAQKSVLIAMTLHELATNAVKYGALSNIAGRVDVTWEVVSVPRPSTLRLHWRESGGPLVATTSPQRIWHRLD